jgi:hypothetical protein
VSSAGDLLLDQNWPSNERGFGRTGQPSFAIMAPLMGVFGGEKR